MEGHVWLQSIGWYPAVPAHTLRPGMVTVWNWGETAEVVSVTPHKSGKTLVVVVRENGQDYPRRFNVGRLVAVKV